MTTDLVADFARTEVCLCIIQLTETMDKVVARRVRIYACGACCRARDVTEVDLNQWGAKFGNPAIFVSLVEWADRVVTE